MKITDKRETARRPISDFSAGDVVQVIGGPHDKQIFLVVDHSAEFRKYVRLPNGASYTGINADAVLLDAELVLR